MADETPTVKIAPDRTAIAILTEFSDEPMNLADVTKSWLAVTSQGHSVWLTAEQVADWTDS